MDRSFQRPIICTYLAWREAKQRGSWFFLFIVTMLFVVMISTHGCVELPVPAYVEEQNAMQRAVPVQWAETPEGLATLAAHGNYGAQKQLEAQARAARGITEDQYFDSIFAHARQLGVDEQAEGLVLDGTRTRNADLFPGAAGIIPAPKFQPYDACSIYGMDQSKWLALNPQGMDKKFRTFYHGYNDRHLNAKSKFQATRTMPDGTIQPPLAAPPDEQRGMTWEDQYDYGGDGNLDGGGDGGFLP
jgi:hypothetical protein